MARIIPINKIFRIVRRLESSPIDAHPTAYDLILEENRPDATGADSWRETYNTNTSLIPTSDLDAVLQFVSSLIPIDPTLGDALPTDPPPPPPHGYRKESPARRGGS